MKNRIKAFLEEPEQDPPAGDYWVISGDCGWFMVTPETARQVERVLDRLWRPRWIAFRDLSGSRIRVLTDKIQSVCESTAEQRAADRALRRAQQQEEKADRRPWEEED